LADQLRLTFDLQWEGTRFESPYGTQDLPRVHKVFRKPKSYLKILGVVRVKRSKFQTGKPKSNRRHRTKFSRPGDVAPGICAPLGLVLKPSLYIPVLYSLTPFDTVQSDLLSGS
jgi:hypothetical protein